MTTDSFTEKFRRFFTMHSENPDHVTGWASCLQLLKLMTCKIYLPFFMNSTSKMENSKILNMYIFFAWRIQTICSFHQRQWLWDWFCSCIKVRVIFNKEQIVIPTFTKTNCKFAQLQKTFFVNVIQRSQKNLTLSTHFLFPSPMLNYREPFFGENLIWYTL